MRSLKIIGFHRYWRYDKKPLSHYSIYFFTIIK